MSDWRSKYFVVLCQHHMNIYKKIESEYMEHTQKQAPTILSGAKEFLFGSTMNLLLAAVPLAFISDAAGWPEGATFVFALIAICPLAERLGFVTEQLALHTNETIGGLLNVSFGNATELIVALSALFQGLFRVVQLTLLGSILSNMLLVLGCAFLFGGFKHSQQKYGKITSQVNMTLLMLSVMGLMFPTILVSSTSVSNLSDIGYSRFTSIVLFSMYLLFLYFQLFTHRHLYEDQPEIETITSPLLPVPNGNVAPMEQSDIDSAQLVVRDLEAGKAAPGGLVAKSSASDDKPEDNNDDEEEEDLLGWWPALAWLAAVTILISFLSDILVATISSTASSAGISGVFLSAIVIPIVGNAAEHAGAVMFARKNKCDLAISIAVGSSTQIALMVMPLLVLIGWMGGRDLTLDFHPYESATMLLTVITVAFAIIDGTSTYLVGAVLIGAYFIVAAGFWAHSPEDLNV